MRKGLFLLALLLVLPGLARADDLYVNCTGGPLGPGEYATINDALNLGVINSNADYRIFITGTCMEKVNLYRRSGISFIGQDDSASVESPAPPNRGVVFNLNGAQFITLQRLNIRNGINGISAQNSSTVTIDNCTIEGSTFNGIQANSNSNVYIGSDPAAPARGVSINGNGGAGIAATESLVEIRGHTTIENNSGSSITLTGGRLRLRAVNTENFIRNNANGIAIGSSASASIEGQNTIQNNTYLGLGVAASSASFQEVVRASDGAIRITTIEGHQNAGAAVSGGGQLSIGGRHRIRNNGDAVCSFTLFCAGLKVYESFLWLSGGVDISNNLGVGVYADLHGSVLIVRPVTITGNTHGDVLLRLLSGASFAPYSNAIGDNVIGSVTCDDTSALGGDLTGISSIACKNVATEKKTK